MRLVCDGSPVLDLVGRLEAGPLAADPSTGIAPVDLIAALAAAALGDEEALGPGLVQASPSHPRLQERLSEPALAALFPGAQAGVRLALASGLLQMHDFWDASHDAAQRADDLGERGYSAYWHAIAHRREPDAGNAAYWFRQVGHHAVGDSLARAAGPCFATEGFASLAHQLAPGGVWNPLAMIDLCNRVVPGTPRDRIARRLQRLEMWLLLEATFEAL
jgi:hypothetical protein